MSVQNTGGVQYTGGYSIHQGDIISTVRDIMSTLVDIMGTLEVFSTPLRYHAYIRGIS